MTNTTQQVDRTKIDRTEVELAMMAAKSAKIKAETMADAAWVACAESEAASAAAESAEAVYEAIKAKLYAADVKAAAKNNNREQGGETSAFAPIKNRCPVCGLPCVCSHAHWLNGRECGCRNNHIWLSEESLSSEDGDEKINNRKEVEA